MFQSTGTQAFSDTLYFSLTFYIGLRAGSTRALWISMCYFTTFASAPNKATVFPTTRQSLSGRKALTTPVSSPRTHRMLFPLLFVTTVADRT